MPPDRADEHAGKRRTASERAERGAVGEALADDEQHERAHGPRARPVRRSWAARSARRRARAEALRLETSAKRIAKPATASPTTGVRRTFRRSTMGWMSNPRRLMPLPSTAAARPIPIAQRISATSGVENFGMSGMAIAKVPNPAHAFSPMKTSDPIPAASRPGYEDHPQHRPTDPGHLHQQEGSGDRRAQQRADRGEAPCRADHHGCHLGRVSLHQVDRQDAEPAADRDERCFRSEHHPEGECGEGGDDDAGKLDRKHCARRLESLRRLVAAGSGQVLDRQADQQSTDDEGRNRPPHRRLVETEILGQRREQVVLRLGDALEEEVGHRRDDDAEDGAEHEEREIAPTLQQFDRCRRSAATAVALSHRCSRSFRTAPVVGPLDARETFAFHSFSCASGGGIPPRLEENLLSASFDPGMQWRRPPPLHRER